MADSHIIKPGDLRTDPIREQHIKSALGHLIDTICAAYPGMVVPLRQGHAVTIMASNGLGLQLRGGLNPNFKPPAAGLVKP